MRRPLAIFFVTFTRLTTCILTLSLMPTPARPDPTLSPASLKSEITTALDKNGIYIAPAMQQDANERAIAATLRKARTPTRVLLLERLPPEIQSPWQLVEAVHKYRHPGDGLVVIVTERPRRIVAYGAGLDKETLQQIVTATAKTFDAEGYAAGIAHIVRLVDQEGVKRSAARIRIIALSIGMALMIAVLLLRRRRRGAA